MAEAKIRAFLSSDVLLRHLFFTPGNRGRDVEKAVEYVEIVDTGPLSPEMTEIFRERVGPGDLHVDDIYILVEARLTDVLLTYDPKLADAAPMVAVRTETPEEFLEELVTAA
jgi:hypothetical protein